MFCSRSFIVLSFILWFVIHFELIFAYCTEYGLKLILFAFGIQLPQHHLTKTLSLPHCVWVYFWTLGWPPGPLSTFSQYHILPITAALNKS